MGAVPVIIGTIHNVIAKLRKIIVLCLHLVVEIITTGILQPVFVNR